MRSINFQFHHIMYDTKERRAHDTYCEIVAKHNTRVEIILKYIPKIILITTTFIKAKVVKTSNI